MARTALTDKVARPSHATAACGAGHSSPSFTARAGAQDGTADHLRSSGCLPHTSEDGLGLRSPVRGSIQIRRHQTLVTQRRTGLHRCRCRRNCRRKCRRRSTKPSSTAAGPHRALAPGAAKLRPARHRRTRSPTRPQTAATTDLPTVRPGYSAQILRQPRWITLLTLAGSRRPFKYGHAQPLVIRRMLVDYSCIGHQRLLRDVDAGD